MTVEPHKIRYVTSPLGAPVRFRSKLGNSILFIICALHFPVQGWFTLWLRSRAGASTVSPTPGRTSRTDTVTSFSFLEAAKHSRYTHSSHTIICDTSNNLASTWIIRHELIIRLLPHTQNDVQNDSRRLEFADSNLQSRILRIRRLEYLEYADSTEHKTTNTTLI